MSTRLPAPMLALCAPRMAVVPEGLAEWPSVLWTASGWHRESGVPGKGKEERLCQREGGGTLQGLRCTCHSGLGQAVLQ